MCWSNFEAAAAEQPLGERLAAQRMRALAAAGRQSDALAVYEDMRARLDEELGIDPSAALRDTHLALLRGELEIPAPRREPITAALPVRLTGFIGRATELAELIGLLADARLVTVVGPGGAGKTRLALEAMDQVDGAVFFVSLAEIGAPDQLADAVAGALDSEQRDRPDKAARLVELLDVGAAVLILDNCEHLIAAAAALADRLLERLPQLRILATSREPLAITGEVLCHLGPLDIPVETTDPVVAQRYSSVGLFVDRAKAVRPGFVLDDHTTGPVVRICRQLDGLPLALELAAAKLRAMSVEQIARRLDDRFRLLSTGSRTALPRQRTLLALVEWSWDLLDDPEKVLIRRLSAFPGGATVDALEAICADDTLSAADIPYLLDGLVEKSLVTVTGGDQPRYRMLETIRVYAAARLAESGDDLGDGFADYFVTLAEQHEADLRGSEQLSAIALFDAEHANMAAALRTAMRAATGADASADATALVVRLVRTLFWYWGIRGMGTQFETTLDGVLRLGEALPADARTAFAVIELMDGAPPTGDETLSTMVEACVRAGGLEFHPALPMWTAMLAARAEDEPLRERQLEQALAHPDVWVRASAHLARDFDLTGRGEQVAGGDARREALHGFEIAGDRWGLGMALLAVGRDRSLRGEHAHAIATYARAVTVAAELGTEDDLCASHLALAEERVRGGEFAEAARDIEAVRRLATDHGYTRLAAVVGFVDAESARRTGDVARADALITELEQRVRHLPYPKPMAALHIATARLANRLTAADLAAARTLLPQVIEGSFLNGDAPTIAQTLARAAELLAELHHRESDHTAAATALGLAEVIRGIPDRGNLEIAALTARIVEELGADAYRDAYRGGSELIRAAALTRLAAEAGQPG